MAEYINVTTLNLLAKQVLEQCEPLNNLIVCGEVSNFTRHYKSGHCYFTLKDENAAIKCVMFRDKARLLGFAPENGMLVLAYGRATLYFYVYVHVPAVPSVPASLILNPKQEWMQQNCLNWIHFLHLFHFQKHKQVSVLLFSPDNNRSFRCN